MPIDTSIVTHTPENTSAFSIFFNAVDDTMLVFVTSIFPAKKKLSFEHEDSWLPILKSFQVILHP